MIMKHSLLLICVLTLTFAGNGPTLEDDYTGQGELVAIDTSSDGTLPEQDIIIEYAFKLKDSKHGELA